eukprot:scaffold49618_cov75-Attheya_sp.AAC.2
MAEGWLLGCDEGTLIGTLNANMLEKNGTLLGNCNNEGVTLGMAEGCLVGCKEDGTLLGEHALGNSNGVTLEVKLEMAEGWVLGCKDDTLLGTLNVTMAHFLVIVTTRESHLEWLKVVWWVVKKMAHCLVNMNWLTAMESHLKSNLKWLKVGCWVVKMIHCLVLAMSLWHTSW